MLERLSQAPILRPEGLAPSHPALEIVGVFNPAAFWFGGKICLLARVAEAVVDQPMSGVAVPIIGLAGLEVRYIPAEDLPAGAMADGRLFEDVRGDKWLTSISHLRFFESGDGLAFSEVPTRHLYPAGAYERFGMEDPRVTQVGAWYHIAYTAVSARGACVGHIRTRDFVTYERLGLLLAGPNKDAAFFPTRVGGRHYLLHRPMDTLLGRPSCWVASSDNGLDYGDHRYLFGPEAFGPEIIKVGGGPEPILTEQGWLFLIHTCDIRQDYRLQVALLGAEDPSIVLAISPAVLLSPELDWEQRGFFDGVVFCNGWVAWPDGRLYIYYGAADSCIGVASTTINQLCALF